MPSNWRPEKRVAIAGGGPGAILTALAILKRGYDVRVFERQAKCKAIGGAVIQSAPVLAILRSYGMGLEHAGFYITTYFANKWGKERTKLPSTRRPNDAWASRARIIESCCVIQTHHEVTGDDAAEDGVAVWSAVLHQARGDPKLFHTPGSASSRPGAIRPLEFLRATVSYPTTGSTKLYDGKPGFVCWVVEPGWEGKPLPEDPEAHVAGILKHWADPMPRLSTPINLDMQVYRVGGLILAVALQDNLNLNVLATNAPSLKETGALVEVSPTALRTLRNLEVEDVLFEDVGRRRPIGISMILKYDFLKI
ncbi:hypothetical protein BDV10DRAFT_189817 [Aspergillus recurvatus]